MSKVFNYFLDSRVPVCHGGLDQGEVEIAVFGQKTAKISSWLPESSVIARYLGENSRFFDDFAGEMASAEGVVGCFWVGMAVEVVV